MFVLSFIKNTSTVAEAAAVPAWTPQRAAAVLWVGALPQDALWCGLHAQLHATQPAPGQPG
eukprot:9388900-Pyramimonas_sp.AAC.1